MKWGIRGYLVLFNHKVIGQFKTLGWAVEFQQIVANLHKGQPVTVLYDAGNSTMIIDDVPQKKNTKRG